MALPLQFLLLILSLGSAIQAASAAAPQEREPSTLRHIDTYGLRKVSREVALQVAQIDVGSPVDVDRDAAVERLRALPGITDAVLVLMLIPGAETLLLGVQEDAAPVLETREEPEGSCRLPEDILKLYDSVQELGLEGMLKGISREEIVDGFALPVYEPAAQEVLLLATLARQHAPLLSQVLRESSDGHARAVAAKAICFLPDKSHVVHELEYGMRDAQPGVRNNAIRALSVLANWANTQPEFAVDLDISPLLVLLESIEWTDRNKAAALLHALSKSRDAALLERLRDTSLPALTEMALWHSSGHAYTATSILGRLAELSDEEVDQADAEARRAGDAVHQQWIFALRDKAARLAQATRAGTQTRKSDASDIDR